jgi:hypothetical protein
MTNDIDISKNQRLYGSLTPAYGRDYKSGKAALTDWNGGKDFVINNPVMQTYCSVRDGDNLPVGSHLQIRWNRLQDVAVIYKQADGTWKLGK